ncbi:hypothetical protein Droror1_Dr00010260 [Drosera rotundifolia]
MCAIKEDPKPSSDRTRWKLMFEGMVKMWQSQKSQIESLLDVRNQLMNRIQLQHERWAAYVRSLGDEISQMKRELSLVESERVLDATKAESMMGLKDTKALFYKHKLEAAEDDLTDLKSLIDEKKLLETPAVNGQSGSANIGSAGKADNHRYQALKKEVEKLKCEYQELSARKDAEVSALLSEKGFVWNQYRIMESDLTSRLKSKNVEVDALNEKIMKFTSDIEQLQSANEEKDDKIAFLEAKLAKLEAETNKKIEVFSGIPQGGEQRRRGNKSASNTPLFKTAAESQNSTLAINACSQTNRPTRAKKGIASTMPVETHDKEKKSLKREAGDSITKAETRVLFSSSFKIPKLKNPHITS